MGGWRLYNVRGEQRRQAKNSKTLAEKAFEELSIFAHCTITNKSQGHLIPFFFYTCMVRINV
jgi:hypothetical protein